MLFRPDWRPETFFPYRIFYFKETLFASLSAHQAHLKVADLSGIPAR